jgi:hypothetical protein
MESAIDKPGVFFNDLYHRFLLTPKTEMKCKLEAEVLSSKNAFDVEHKIMFCAVGKRGVDEI